jgi:hypothetical protein
MKTNSTAEVSLDKLPKAVCKALYEIFCSARPYNRKRIELEACLFD